MPFWLNAENSVGWILKCQPFSSRLTQELERSFLQKLDRREEIQPHFKYATEALRVLMRQIFENCDISVEIKLPIGSEITIRL